MTRKDLIRTSGWTDYFNLVLLLAVFVSGLIVWATEDITFIQLRVFIADLVSFRPTGPVSSWFAAHMILAAAFLIYLPFTHMTHFVGKYFTYHKVRWEDHPNLKGSALEKKVEQALGYKLNWTAPHIKTGATWAEATTEGDKQSE